MDHITEFMGKPLRYWLELDRQAQTLNYDSLVDQISVLRYKVDQYEKAAAMCLRLDRLVADRVRKCEAGKR